jgi:hypothetical protein
MARNAEKTKPRPQKIIIQPTIVIQEGKGMGIGSFQPNARATPKNLSSSMADVLAIRQYL